MDQGWLIAAPTLVALMAFLQGLRLERKAGEQADELEEKAKELEKKASEKAGELDTKLAEIHRLTDGHLSEVQTDLALANARIEELQKFIARLDAGAAAGPTETSKVTETTTPQGGHTTVTETSKPSP